MEGWETRAGWRPRAGAEHSVRGEAHEHLPRVGNELSRIRQSHRGAGLQPRNINPADNLSFLITSPQEINFKMSIKGLPASQSATERALVYFQAKSYVHKDAKKMLSVGVKAFHITFRFI